MIINPFITTILALAPVAPVLYQSDPVIFPPNGLVGPAGVVNFDDVLVDNSLHNPGHTPLAITQLTYGIMREPGATATTLTAYWTDVSLPPRLDDPVLLHSPHVIGSIDLPAYEGTITMIEGVSFGNGVDPLFVVSPEFFDVANYGEFVIGLQHSNTDGWNQWAIAQYTEFDSAANFDWSWFYYLNSGQRFAYSLNDPDTGEPIHTTYVLQARGFPTPEVVAEPLALMLIILPLVLFGRNR